MRRLIAAMKLSLDGKYADAEGYPDWVQAWSDDYEVSANADACLLGGDMYGGYQSFWTAVQAGAGELLPGVDRPPTAGEIEYGRFVARTPHYVLSGTMTSALWPQTRFLRKVEEVAALKQTSGKDIYLVGGGRTASSLMDAGLVDELRLILHPLIAGEGLALFETTRQRRALALRDVRRLDGGRISLVYGIG